MYETENIVLYDWLSFTTKEYSPEEIIEMLGLSHVPWSDTKGARGYRDRKYFNCISIHYNGRADMGVWCEMSGQGCRAFESLSDVGWDNLFDLIQLAGMKITRLDVAFDDHTGVLPLKEVIDDTQCGMYVSRSDYWETRLSSKGSMIQIGSPQSKILIRIYDKAAERGYDSDTHWVRCEMQLRDDRALEFSKLSEPIGQAFAGVLLNYLRYVVPADDQNRWRWPMTKYWADLISNAERIKIYRSPGMEYNEERCRRYVVNQAGNAIDAMIQIHGLDGFKRLIDERTVNPNPKYEQIVREHRFSVMDCLKDIEEKRYVKV